MPAMPQACKVANTLWTPGKSQGTSGGKQEIVAPTMIRWACKWRARSGVSDVPEKGMFRESDWRGIQEQK